MFLLTLAQKLPSTEKQLNSHLQCYHLQCFSFARSVSSLFRNSWVAMSSNIFYRIIRAGIVVFCLLGSDKSHVRVQYCRHNHPFPSSNPKRKHRNRDTTRHYVTLFCTISFENMLLLSRAAKRGGFKRGGGFPIWTGPSFFVLFCPFLSFFGAFPIFLGFSRFARGWSGDLPDLSFSSFSAL